MTKYKRLTRQNINFILKMYQENIREFGEPNYTVILEKLKTLNPPINLTKQAISYQVKTNLKKGMIDFLNPVPPPSAVNITPESEESPIIGADSPEPRYFEPQNFIGKVYISDQITPQPPFIPTPPDNLFNPNLQVSSLLDASRKKKEVETELLQHKLALLKGKLKDIQEVEDEKVGFLKVVETSFDSLMESFFNEARPMLIADNISGAKSVITELKHSLLGDIEKLVFQKASQDSTPTPFSKQRYSNPLNWAENNRIMADGDSPWTGRFSYKMVPFMREIIECFAEDSPVREVALKKGAQVMGTTCLTENIVGFYMSENPCNILIVAPTVQLLDLNVQPRIVRMIKGAGLEKILTNAPRRNLIKFKGGQLFFAGATSPDRFRNISVKILILEELSGFPKTGLKEGSVKDLARSRTRVFEASRKILYISSALRNGDDIDVLFSQGDCRYYQVPCPECGAFQVLRFENLKYDFNEQNKVKNACYVCNACQLHIQEHQKPVLFDKGKWVSQCPENEREDFRSYHLCGLYSPFGLQSWNEICQLYEDAKTCEERMQVFQNTVLGENYSRVQVALPNQVDVITRQKNGCVLYTRGTSPLPILYATIGVDVQKDRLEVEVVGWCADKVNFSIEYYIFEGDPDLLLDEMGCWNKLNRLQKSIAESGIPTVCLIDSGDSPMRVYDYISMNCQEKKWTFPILGEARPTLNFPYKIRPVLGYSDMNRLHVNTSYLKTLFFNDSFQSLPLEKQIPTRYVGMPQDYSWEHFQSLYFSERPDTKVQSGRDIITWTQVHTNNHALDCRVYAMAGAFWIREWVSKNILGSDRINASMAEEYLQNEIGSKILDLKDFMVVQKC